MRTWLACFGVAIPFLVFAACGARTGLNIPDAVAFDAGIDAPPDVHDALPPPVDAPPDVHQEDCVEAGLTYIYVVTAENELLSFNPPGAVFTTIGSISCPATANATPFSMGVDRKGSAYVVFTDGELFKVSTATAICDPTSFAPLSGAWQKFGMGFATKQNGPAESLFVAASNFATPSAGLGTIDTTTFAFKMIAPFSQGLGTGVELTGTGDGRLFGFFIDTMSARLAEIDKTNGKILSNTPLAVPAAITDFAFAFWGGDFYLFHAEMMGPTTVTRYRPSDGSLTDVASLGTHVVGVGVSTCAPQ